MQTRKSAFLALMVLILALPVFSDTRTENIDIILALDKSLSMAEEHKIDGVKSYVDSWLLDQVLIPGDNLIIVDFYGKADVIVSQKIQSKDDISKVKSIISQIRANGRFTDIGNALDSLKAQLDKYANDGRKKFVLLMTDGRQEAPPTSKYYAKNGTFNHEFLANTKTIQKEGWKIQILGIGTDAEAKQLADQLSGSYTQITGSVTPEALKAQTENLLGTVSVVGTASVSRVGMGGRSSVNLVIKSEGYSREIAIGIGSILVELPTRHAVEILKSPYTITVPATGSATVKIPVTFPADLPAGTASGTISFSFQPGERFNPSEFAVSFTVAGVVENYWWIALIGLAVIALIVLAVVFMVRRSSGAGGTRFSVLIDDKKVSQDSFTLKSGGELFLGDADGAFAMAGRRSAHSFARFRVKEGVLGFDILKIQRFPKRADAAIEGVMGNSYAIRGEDGATKELRIESAEARPQKAMKPAKPAPVTVAKAPPASSPRTKVKPRAKKPKAATAQTKVKARKR